MHKRTSVLMLFFALSNFWIISNAIADKIESAGATINGMPTNAVFRGEASATGKLVTDRFFEVTNNLDVLAEIQVDPSDVGKTAYLYAAVYYENKWYLKTNLDSWVEWQPPYAITALLPFRGPQPLSAIEKLEIARQFYGFVGSYQVYFGYQAENIFHYNTVPLKFVIQRKLNDTGVSTCGDSQHQNLSCPVVNYPGQDGNHGRDALAALGKLIKKGNGIGGFDFTKIAGNGDELPENAIEWSCVRDNATGLVWEIKTDDGQLHDKDWMYTWHEPNEKNNGGYQGVQQANDSCGNFGACNTTAYVTSVNQEGWCGRKTWRIPTVDELSGIASLNKLIPSIDGFYFKDTQSFLGARYWTSTPVVTNFHYAWAVDFFAGQNNWQDKSSRYFVRLVSDTYHL